MRVGLAPSGALSSPRWSKNWSRPKHLTPYAKAAAGESEGPPSGFPALLRISTLMAANTRRLFSKPTSVMGAGSAATLSTSSASPNQPLRMSSLEQRV